MSRKKEDIEKLITDNNRRLQILNEQKAKYGLDSRPHILIEIEDIEVEIEKLQSKLAGLQVEDKPNLPTFPPKKPRDSDPSSNPLSFKNILAGIIITVIGGVIVAFIIQDARFTSISETPTSSLSVPTPSIPALPATSRPTAIPIRPTPTLEPPTTTPIKPTNAPSSIPTSTNTPVPPTVTSTHTPVPPTLTPTLIQFSIDTPSPTNTTPAEPASTIPPESVDTKSTHEMVAPILEYPPDGDSVQTGFDTTFKWKWDGELLEGQYFEILVWQADDPHNGAFNAEEVTNKVQFSDMVYQFTGKLEGAERVNEHGTGEYLWAVVVVKLDPYEHIVESLPRKLKINVSVGGGDSGGNSRPTPAPP